MSIHFDKLHIGDQARILGYSDMPTAYRKKLMSLGLTPGTEFTVKRSAPFGDPIEITLRGFNLSLRSNEASGLVVEKL
ncbi:MAG: ferrous iron transport protein A [Gammaproteobacteria bacterium]|nr:MAG: ferrous iron transport protein A [Gammaproteobacteria bacterium]